MNWRDWLIATICAALLFAFIVALAFCMALWPLWTVIAILATVLTLAVCVIYALWHPWERHDG